MARQYCAARIGSGGFGYDPVFIDAELGVTSAQLIAEEKNATQPSRQSTGRAGTFARRDADASTAAVAVCASAMVCSKVPVLRFNSHTAGADAPRARYIEALLADLDIEAKRARNRPLISVFLGGGTPSLFPPDDIAVLIDGYPATF